ncbi:MAG: hypothetical protein OES79_08325 [Planctomycetota bacterium]|nr:hypothetical protein [Planctomycetota bacterium]
MKPDTPDPSQEPNAADQAFDIGQPESSDGAGVSNYSQPTDPPLAADGNSSDAALADSMLPPTMDAAANDEDHDATVEQYLAQLLGRYDTGAGAAMTSPVSSPAVDSTNEHSVSPAPAEVVAVETPVEDAPRERRRPPVRAEAAADMSAMRELANAAARRAIATHTHKTTVAVACGKLLLAGIALTASYLLIQMASSAAATTYFLGLLALGLGGYWGYQYMRLAGGLAQVTKSSRPVADAISESSEPAIVVDDEQQGGQQQEGKQVAATPIMVDSMSDTHPIVDPAESL